MASRALRAFRGGGGRKPTKHAPAGLMEGGQFIGPAFVGRAIIRALLGEHGERSDRHSLGGVDVDERGAPASRARNPLRAFGRVRSAGGGSTSHRLASRRPRMDDTVVDRETGVLGRVATVNPDGTGRVEWQDGRVESRPLSSLEPVPVRERDPGRSFGADRGAVPARMDDAVARGEAGRPRTAAERMRDAVAAGAVVGRDRQRALDVARGERPRPTSAEIDDQIRDAAGAPGGGPPDRSHTGGDSLLVHLERQSREAPGAKPPRKSAARKMAAPKAQPDIKAIRRQIFTAGTREEADALTEGLTTAQLRELQVEMGMVPVGRTKPEIRRHIAEVASAEAYRAGIAARGPSLELPGASARGADLPSGADIEVVSSTRDLTGEQIVRGEHLTPAGRRALDALGPAGHPRIAAIPDTEGKIREAYRMLAIPGGGQDHYVPFEDLRKLIGEQVPRSEVDDTLRRMDRMSDVNLSPQHYGRANADTRIPAAVQMGGALVDQIHIDDPTLSRPSQFPALLMADELDARRAGRPGDPMMALISDADLQAEIDARATRDPIVARDLALRTPSAPVSPTRRGDLVPPGSVSVPDVETARALPQVRSARQVQGGDIAVWQASNGETAVGRVVDLGPRRRFIDWEGGRREPLSHRSASNVTFHREGAPTPRSAAERMAGGRTAGTRVTPGEAAQRIRPGPSPAVARMGGQRTPRTKPLSQGQYDNLEGVSLGFDVLLDSKASPLLREGLIERVEGGQQLGRRAQYRITDAGRRALADRPAGFDYLAAAERISTMSGEDEIVAVLADVKVPDLNKLAREMSIVFPYGRTLTPDERRRYMAEQIVRDRGRFHWR